MCALSIKEWSAQDRPREKSILHGPQHLSDAELLAILIGSGYKEKSAVELSKEILASTQFNLLTLGKYSTQELTQFKGIGPAKAVNIKAALELGLRHTSYMQEQAPSTLSSSSLAFKHIYPKIHSLTHEEFWISCLNPDFSVIETLCISKGSTNATLVDVKIICKKAVLNLSHALIVYHNHPSGSLKASKADLSITKSIQKALDVFQIKLADHLIIGNNKYLSFADQGYL